MSQPDSVIQLDNVRFLRGSRCIFENVSLQVPAGKVTAILGPSGTGKTTLLHLIGGLLKPNSGQVRVFDHDVPALSRKPLMRLRQRMGFLFQSGALFTGLSVFDNVAFPLREHLSLPEALVRDVVLMKLEAVGLRGARDLMPSELSGGMARRVALARSIALDPDILLYDEPFTGQDPISMGVLVKLIRTLNDALGLTSVVVSHDVSEVLSIADHVCILAQGTIIGSGAPKAILANKDPQIQQFVHGQPDGPVAFHYPAPELAADFVTGDC